VTTYHQPGPAITRRTTPELTGTVTNIAADIVEDQRTGQSYYTVRVGVPADELGRLKGLRPVPGMPVEVFIRTEERTMLSYLLRPLIDHAWRAFRET
jgi:HlyD family secretion protein